MRRYEIQDKALGPISYLVSHYNIEDIMKNQYRIIDAHCHIYPEKIAARAVASTDEFYNTHANGTGLVQNLIALGEEAGYDGYVVQSVASTPITWRPSTALSRGP